MSKDYFHFKTVPIFRKASNTIPITKLQKYQEGRIL